MNKVISGKEHTIDVGAYRDAPLHMIDTFRSKPGKNISGNHLKSLTIKRRDNENIRRYSIG